MGSSRFIDVPARSRVVSKKGKVYLVSCLVLSGLRLMFQSLKSRFDKAAAGQQVTKNRSLYDRYLAKIEKSGNEMIWVEGKQNFSPF